MNSPASSALTSALAALALSLPPLPLAAATAPPGRIQVLEPGTGRPVPLVQLRTTHDLVFVTDNAGLIAFDAPESMGRESWFGVIGQGYEVPKDGFGYQGVRLKPQPGGQLSCGARRRRRRDARRLAGTNLSRRPPAQVRRSLARLPREAG